MFLVSRIREFWLASDRTRADNDESAACGIAHTGRIITAAALIMSISFAALIAAQVTVMNMFGIGLTLVILVDATLVHMVLAPAFMHIMGQWNWWHRGGWFQCTDDSVSVTAIRAPQEPHSGAIEPTGSRPRV